MHVRDYRLLDYFVEIVNQGSITAAAENLNVSIPVVSQALHDLESVVGHSLLVRGRGRQALTESGEQVYPLASQMRQAARRAMIELMPTDAEVEGVVSITMSTEISTSWFPGLYRKFRAEFPGVEVRVDARDELVDLSDSRQDISLRADYSLRGENLSGDPMLLANLPLTVVVSPELNWDSKLPFSRRMQSVPFIRFSQTSKRSELEARHRKTRRKSQVSLRSEFLVNSGVIARELAVNGVGAALVIEQSAAPMIKAGTLIAIAPDYDFGYVVLKLAVRDRYPPPPVRSFVTFCQRYAKAD